MSQVNILTYITVAAYAHSVTLASCCASWFSRPPGLSSTMAGLGLFDKSSISISFDISETVVFVVGESKEKAAHSQPFLARIKVNTCGLEKAFADVTERSSPACLLMGSPAASACTALVPGMMRLRNCVVWAG